MLHIVNLRCDFGTLKELFFSVHVIPSSVDHRLYKESYSAVCVIRWPGVI